MNLTVKAEKYFYPVAAAAFLFKKHHHYYYYYYYYSFIYIQMERGEREIDRKKRKIRFGGYVDLLPILIHKMLFVFKWRVYVYGCEVRCTGTDQPTPAIYTRLQYVPDVVYM